MNIAKAPENVAKPACNSEELAAVLKAFNSPYCTIAPEDKFYKSPYMYFTMNSEMKISGVTSDPIPLEGEICVAASGDDCIFIAKFQINWPKSDIYYWQLETYRAYEKARQALFEIQQVPKKKRREHLEKIESFRY